MRKKWLFKCRIDDIDVKGNRRWQYENITCFSCNSNLDETQQHILLCKTLIGKSEIPTYIPNYLDLFGENIEDKLYVSRLIKDNPERRVVEL